MVNRIKSKKILPDGSAVFYPHPIYNKAANTVGDLVVGDIGIDTIEIIKELNGYTTKDLRIFLKEYKDNQIDGIVPKSNQGFQGFYGYLFTEQQTVLYAKVYSSPSKNAMLNLQWSPIELGEGHHLLHKFISHLLLNSIETHEYMQYANVKRLHVKCDLYNADLNRLGIIGWKVAKKHVVFTKTGALESIYFGWNKQNIGGIAYDKIMQLKQKHALNEKKHEHIANHDYVTRLEYRHAFNSKNPQLLKNLPKLNNPFEDVVVWNFAHASNAFERYEHMRLFLDSWTMRGFKKAITLLPEILMERYKKGFDIAPKDNPINQIIEKKWKRWPKVVAEIVGSKKP